MPTQKGKQWDVDAGVAVIITAGIPTATSQKVPAARLDREIARLGRRKAQATKALAGAKEELDALTKEEAEMKALRARVTADPPE